ncbi:hypothetical protein [Bosea sp. CS1GBMeth4]|uniref:hypothetical protein n=1 Tax=Bosea sp. CS1GBMeth4 TaxID=1892849 RepID=UPI00164950E0|nr:hypothetical protein [Bosea sp. CS1GBMeth4]
MVAAGHRVHAEEVRVSATSSGTETPIPLAAGHFARFSNARPGQRWLTHPHGSEGWCGPGGNGVRFGGGNEGSFAVSRHPPGGRPSMYFMMRDDDVLTIAGPGRLFMTAHDNDRSDNQGELVMLFEIFSGPPAAESASVEQE